MKKFLFVFILGIAVVGCAKKMTPASGGNTPVANNGAVAATPLPPAPPVIEQKVATNAPVNTNTEAGSQASKTTRDASTLTHEMQGQAIYNAKCGRCHGLKVTTDYTADRWISIMQVMATKANLNDTEKENVLAYVKANSKK